MNLCHVCESDFEEWEGEGEGTYMCFACLDEELENEDDE
tara:strand:- start:710 stop:826 length:117 start_codon:yes stop_codon:yes gene_type:complete